MSAEIVDLLRQMEETYGVRIAHLAADHQPFLSIGELCISPCCRHPLAGAPFKNSRSFHMPTNTYYVSPPANYVRLASADWPTRVGAYSDAVETGIASVAKTRLTPEERETLLTTARRARSEVSASPPAQIVKIGPVYVPSEAGAGPILSFSPYPGMIAVEPDDILNYQPVFTSREERVFKHYGKREGSLQYREAWFANDTTIQEHWGVCGKRGETRSHAHQSDAEARERYMRLKRAGREEGFCPIPLSKHAKLVVEFHITEMGTPSDADRRHALEDFLDDLIGWLGLGHLDGGSTGSGTMEAMCLVVDFQIAKTAVEEALRNSPFSDFARIYRER